MSSPAIARTWRKLLADLHERESGPLPDPVPTFGADLITAPSTPVLSASIAGPDLDFLEKLDQSINVAFATPIPDYQNDSESYSESSSDDEDCAPWPSQAHAAWFLKMAPAPRITRKDQKRKLPDKREDEHSMQDTQPHKRPRRTAKRITISMESKTSFSQSKQQTRSAKEHHPLYSPPQTPSPTAQTSPKDRINSAQSRKSLASQPRPSMQQPTPEADKPLLQRELRQKSASTHIFQTIADGVGNISEGPLRWAWLCSYQEQSSKAIQAAFDYPYRNNGNASHADSKNGQGPQSQRSTWKDPGTIARNASSITAF
ncbi:hypothetical protein FPOAC1_003956 [Fusarium poae]|uniref:hypothetical protein n=1 Tax=Fusarium poae TaxID=36050 RepID=UPI001CE89C18|nr:hypothetical protein FPOAC1_003956 [Fusarium poae]KAG8670721.1 hypothetical protein FPOAC1_003956 [Fusarium poae]